MKWLLLLSFFLVVPYARAEYLQEFKVGGVDILSPITQESLSFLYEKNQAPEFVYKDFGSLISLVRVSAIFWQEAEAGELPLREVIISYITYWAEKRDLPVNKVLAIAKCESNNLNPKAFNPKDTDNKPKYGLFQFGKDTFVGEDIWDWKAQTIQATKLMSEGKWRKWPWCNDHWEDYIPI